MIEINPIAYIENNIIIPQDCNWAEIISTITLRNDLSPDCLSGLDQFSHIEIIYYFHLVSDSKICFSKRHPQNNPDWPAIGIFSQRGKNRPNKIGATICPVLKIQGNEIIVKGLDAVNNTPVIDIKPVFKEYLPTNVHQPAWVNELMKNYW